jgi:hypothetical protein
VTRICTFSGGQYDLWSEELNLRLQPLKEEAGYVEKREPGR